ncbi:hypothetical protein BKA81DRAFT_377003 [Phyllosticta paracitricarpa]|uniref:Uncharacterized protein n=1 Tax=Phyllosticta citricarpa TaxID=55181 RepID=A0ABR1MRF1_9PEZI
MFSTMAPPITFFLLFSLSYLPFDAQTGSKDEGEAYTNAELLEKIHELDLPAKERAQDDDSDNGDHACGGDQGDHHEHHHQQRGVYPHQTTDTNFHHQTVGPWVRPFMEPLDEDEDDADGNQPRLTVADAVHTSTTTTPRKLRPRVPDLPLERQMECAVYAKNAPIYIDRARKQQQVEAPAPLPRLPPAGGSYTPSDNNKSSCCPTWLNCSCCGIRSSTPPSSPNAADGPSIHGHHVFRYLWTKYRASEEAALAAAANANALSFSRRPVPTLRQQQQQQQQQQGGLIAQHIAAVQHDMQAGRGRSRVRFAPILARPRRGSLPQFPEVAASTSTEGDEDEEEEEDEGETMPPPPTPPRPGYKGGAERKERRDGEDDGEEEEDEEQKKRDSVLKEEEENDEAKDEKRRDDTHAARFQRLFGAEIAVEDLPDAFGSSVEDGEGEEKEERSLNGE